MHHEEGVDLVTANLELSAMEFNLVNAMSRETALRNYLSEVKDKYDYILIDCMLISIPPKYSVSQIMGYLKGKSSLMIFDRHANLKYKYGNRHFWARGYFVDTVGRNKKQIQEYIRNQLTEDKIADQIELKEFVDPFTGSVNK